MRLNAWALNPSETKTKNSLHRPAFICRSFVALTCCYHILCRLVSLRIRVVSSVSHPFSYPGTFSFRSRDSVPPSPLPLRPVPVSCSHLPSKRISEGTRHFKPAPLRLTAADAEPFNGGAHAVSDYLRTGHTTPAANSHTIQRGAPARGSKSFLFLPLSRGFARTRVSTRARSSFLAKALPLPSPYMSLSAL